MILIAFLFGLVFGSFLNVCIHRMPKDLSVIGPRSYCPKCTNDIRTYDLIPVLSFLFLRGRCRDCHEPIPWRYPLVELLTATLFAAIIAWLGFDAVAVKYLVFVFLLIGLVFSDIDALLLPDQFTLGGLALGIIFAWWVTPVQDISAAAALSLIGGKLGRLETMDMSLLEAVVGLVFPAALLWLTGYVYEKLRHREGLGLGDVKMIAMIGAFLGLRGAVMTLVVGSVLGSIIGLTVILVKRKDAATYELPFGAFLGVGAACAALWEELNRVVS